VTVLVTGATGFIGSHLVSALVKTGAKIRCLRRTSSNLRWLPQNQIELFTANLQTGEGLAPALQGVDIVFHLAGATKALNAEEYYRSNVNAMNRLLQEISFTTPNLKRFVFLSSQAAVGPAGPGKIIDETAVCKPITCYGESKLAAERLLADYPSIPWVILRSVAVYGPRDRDFLAIIKSIKNRIAPIIGSKEKRLTFVHVEDVVQALLLAARNEKAVGATYFITDGNIYTWTDLKTLIEKILGCRAASVYFPLPLVWLAAFFSEIWSRITRIPTIMNLNRFHEFTQENWACSSRKLQLELGYRPKYLLETGLRQTVSWAKSNGWL